MVVVNSLGVVLLIGQVVGLRELLLTLLLEVLLIEQLGFVKFVIYQRRNREIEKLIPELVLAEQEEKHRGVVDLVILIFPVIAYINL